MEPFGDLTNTHFPSREETEQSELQEKQNKKQQKEHERLLKQVEQERIKEAKRLEKEAKKSSLVKAVKVTKEADSELFSNEGSEILGKERRMLMKKLQQYKELFKEELKGFKVKKAATVEELKAFIEECENIVSVSACDQFILDGLLSSLKMIEGISAHTKNYNISGLSDLLKANPHFHSLAKQLFLKYGLFSSTPPEYQMLFLVVTTAYICRSKNAKKEEMMSFLQQPIPANNVPV